MTTFTVRAEKLPEQVVPGRRLGRHIWHDNRSRAYAVPELPAAALQSVSWERHIPVLDQGNVGSCTGNALVGALASGPLWDALGPAGRALMSEGEPEALRIYSQAETIDGDGPYPPNDNGSYGLSVAKAAKNDGFISGYRHAFSFAALQAALQAGPVIIGAEWRTGMDNPDSRGLVTFTGTVRGGHEFECRQLDMANQVCWFDNSWGDAWGEAGRFAMTFPQVVMMLAAQGDVTQPLPLTSPPPVPVPVTHPDLILGHDPRIIAWASHVHEGDNAYAAKAITLWRKAKGYTS
jgi:hypothetical protein